MKLLVVISVIACSYAAQLDRSYLPPPGATASGGSPGPLSAPREGPDQGFGPSSAPGLNIPAGTPGSFGQPAAQYGPPSGAPGSPLGSFGLGAAQTPKSNTLGSYQYQPERARASLDRNAETLRYDNRIDGDTFAYSFETSNGITADEAGIATNGVQAQGGYAYTADDGQVYRVTYTADQNGYQPQGEHLPTPHPIPEEILKSIEQNARAAAAGIQEGAYNPNEGTSLSNQQYTSSAGFNRDQGYQYDTPSAGISRSDTGTSDSFQGSQSGSGPTSSYQYNAPGSGSQLGTTGYQSQSTSQQYNTPNTGTSGSLTVSQGTFGTTQPNKGSSRPSNQYIPPASGQGYNPSGSSQTVQIGSRQQYNAPTARPTAARPVPNPTASAPSPSGFAPSGLTAGPTSPTSYTSSSSISPFAVSNTLPSGFSPSAATASRPSPTAFASTGPSPSTSGFAPSSPTAGVQISEYSKTGQVSPQQSDDGYNYNRPQPGFSDSRTPQTPAGSQMPTSGSNQGFIINVQSSTGSDQTPQGQYQPNQPSGSRTSMTAAYEYDRPGTQLGAPGTAGTGKSDDGRSGAFGAPRQPPSFSQDEGYKY